MLIVIFGNNNNNKWNCVDILLVGKNFIAFVFYIKKSGLIIFLYGYFID